MTMTIYEKIAMHRDEILALAARHGATHMRVFGSVARGEADAESDVDFVVLMEAGRTLLDVGGLLMDLRDLLGTEVDIVTEGGLKGAFHDVVLSEAVPVEDIAA